MPITIKKQDGDIKFYGSGSEPILTIYGGEQVALLGYTDIVSVKNAVEVSDAVMVAGLFVNSMLIKDSKDFKINNIKVRYINEADLTTKEALYSARKLLNWLESDKIVTVNKKDRVRYKFTRFAYEDGKLIILYKPVAW